MKIFFAIMAILLPVIMCASSIDGPSITDETGKGLRIVAVNMPYLLTLGADDMENALTAVKNQGFDTARIYASYCGDTAYTFQKEPGVFNEKQFEKLDTAVAFALKTGLKLIIALSDNSPQFGGKEIYGKWAGGSNDNVFFKDLISRDYFKKYVKFLLERKNTKSGSIYSTDPAIIGWDLCAGATDASDPDGTVLFGWADDMSSYVKSIDKVHFVILGMGFSSNREDIFKLPSVDMSFFTVSIGAKDSPAQAIGSLSSDALSLYSLVNKPVGASFSCSAQMVSSVVSDAASSFFGSKGSLLIYDYEGFRKYAGAEGSMDFDSPSLSDGLKKSLELAASMKDKFVSIKISNISSIAQSDSASISVVIGSDADLKLMYGEKTPLLQSVELKGAKAGANVLNITGLKPETDYLCCIIASGGDKSGISKVTGFKTKAVKRMPSVKFSMSNNFIKAKGTDFYDGGKIYRYVGTNNYYVRSYYLSNTAGAKNRAKIDTFFDEAAKAGFKVIRLGSNGEVLNASLVNKDDPTHDFRIGPDKFNEIAYKSIDYCIDSAKRHNVRVILHFTDNWEYYGGVPVYAKWAGVQKNDFWVNPECKKFFKQTIDAYVNRKNTVSGVLYKNDPTIFAYDLMNEPRNENDTSSKQMNEWVAEMSSYVKSEDPNHMVTTGMEGFFLKEDGTHYSGTDFIGSHKPASIDYSTFHIYPASPYNHFSASTTKWIIEDYIKRGHEKTGKPVVMEEYGIPNGLEEYPKPQWVDAMTGEFFAAGGNGVNYWMLIDPTYFFGDGNQVSYADATYMNIFIKYANEINKAGY